MGRYQKHIFVCTNERPAGHPRGCCKAKGSEHLLNALKKGVAARGLQDQVRINRSGCLDACEHGAVAVVYPDGIWYEDMTDANAEEIIEQHIVGGKPVERFRIRKDAYR